MKHRTPGCSLRLAKEGDQEELVTLLREFISKTPYRNLSVSDEKLHHIIETGIQKPEEILVLVWANEAPQGILVATSAELPFSLDRAASELAWYVREPFRTKGVIKMRRAFEYWAKEKVSAVATSMSALDDETLPRVTRLYEREGYTRTERAFMKVF